MFVVEFVVVRHVCDLSPHVADFALCIYCSMCLFVGLMILCSVLSCMLVEFKQVFDVVSAIV